MGRGISIFLFGGGWARKLTSAECTPKWNLHFTLPTSGKKFAVHERAVSHLCIS